MKKYFFVCYLLSNTLLLSSAKAAESDRVSEVLNDAALRSRVIESISKDMSASEELLRFVVSNAGGDTGIIEAIRSLQLALHSRELKQRGEVPDHADYLVRHNYPVALVSTFDPEQAKMAREAHEAHFATLGYPPRG